MSSKADYLKKYLSGEASKKSKKEKKKRKKIKKGANLAIHDDDVDWRSLIPQDQPETEEEDEEDEAPQIAEFKDDSIRKVVKWQPVDSNKAHSEEEDLSPPRLSGGRMCSPDLSPPRREHRQDSDDDLSPPRKRKYIPRPDRGVESQARRARKRHDSPQLIESGNSIRKRHDSDENSPPKRKRHDSDDNSPPRRKRHDSDDNSPPRKKRHDSDDNSPPRRKRHDSDGNSSSRKTRDTTADNSPPRQKREDLKANKDLSKKDRMSSGATAGLQNAQVLKEENAIVRKRQEDFFKSLDPTVSGRHADTVYRDKKGKKVDPKLEKLQQREKEKEMEEENEKFMKWGRGAAQAKSYEEKLQDDLYEMSKPLARYADDEDLEKMLKGRERAGDPMLAFIKKSNPVSDKPGKRARKERPTYKGAFPPNRYGIKPGYRWDGVNRSNGFEKTRFSKEANKMAVAEEAYKWSVEDM